MGRAKTTQAVRALIQRSQASNAALSRELGIDVKTVAKWRKRDGLKDARMGPKQVRSTVLSLEEEAIIVALRRHTRLALDDCLYALQPTIPHLTRFSLHRHGIGRLPEGEGDQPKKTFKRYPIGYFHIDIAELRTGEGKIRLFVAIDRTAKFAYVELHERVGKMSAAQFLRNLIAAVPYRIHTILTDNGVQFTHRKPDRFAFEHIFDRVCADHQIEHRLTNDPHLIDLEKKIE